MKLESESDRLEYKSLKGKGGLQPPTVARAIVALANASGGKVVLGVQDQQVDHVESWEPDGSRREDLQAYDERLRSHLLDSLFPRLIVHGPSFIETDSGWFAEYVVDSVFPAAAFHRDGNKYGFWIRDGKNSVPMSITEVAVRLKHSADRIDRAKKAELICVDHSLGFFPRSTKEASSFELSKLRPSLSLRITAIPLVVGNGNQQAWKDEIRNVRRFESAHCIYGEVTPRDWFHGVDFLDSSDWMGVICHDSGLAVAFCEVRLSGETPIVTSEGIRAKLSSLCANIQQVLEHSLAGPYTAKAIMECEKAFAYATQPSPILSDMDMGRVVQPGTYALATDMPINSPGPQSEFIDAAMDQAFKLRSERF